MWTKRYLSFSQSQATPRPAEFSGECVFSPFKAWSKRKIWQNKENILKKLLLRHKCHPHLTSYSQFPPMYQTIVNSGSKENGKTSASSTYSSPMPMAVDGSETLGLDYTNNYSTYNKLYYSPNNWYLISPSTDTLFRIIREFGVWKSCSTASRLQ